MFISKSFLSAELGIDEEIATFFVDRKVPTENAFWNNRTLYIARGNGFISIPAYYDLLFRTGISKRYLLEEKHIVLMEKIMHHAIEVELGKSSYRQQVENIKALLENRIKNNDFFNELSSYLEQPLLKPLGRLGMPVPALNRADVFLFILCDLPIKGKHLTTALRYWYALHTTYLLMDDLYDYEKDKIKSEENAIAELGDGEQGFKKAFEILYSNMDVLEKINPVLTSFYRNAFKDLHKTVV